jgi:hypothetical protein
VIKTRLFTGVALLISIALLQTGALAQKKKEKRENVLLHPDKFYKKYFPRLKIKQNPPDSLFIRTYAKYLAVGAHVFSPATSIDIISRKSGPSNFDPSSKFRTDISNVVGIVASYRFVSAGFAFLSGTNVSNGYIPSLYHTATIQYSSAAYAFEFKYMRIQGFTDINQPGGLLPSPMYTARPDILSREYHFVSVYNLRWKKYSYVAPLTFSQRQIVSQAGFLLKTGLYYNQLSGDSPLINPQQQQYYDNFSNVTGIRSYSIRIAPGLGGNLVFFKHVYISAVAFTSFDLYFYKYFSSSGEDTDTKEAFVFVLDGKASLGYQSTHLYAGIRYESERRAGALQGIEMHTTYSYAGVELGYRFDAPRIVKKVYKETMPPGM